MSGTSSANATIRLAPKPSRWPTSTRSLPWLLPDSTLWHFTAGARRPLETARASRVAAYNPEHVEFAPMDAVFSRYPVTCGTRGQAEGVKEAFARSEALRNPQDPAGWSSRCSRRTGCSSSRNGCPAKAPLQAIWEAMDAGDIVIESRVPQGPETFVSGDCAWANETDDTSGLPAEQRLRVMFATDAVGQVRGASGHGPDLGARDSAEWATAGL